MVRSETRETADAARDALRDAISRATLHILGEPPDDVIIAPPHTVLKTSSGKIRRSASRELYEAGLIGAHAPGVATQIARLALHALVLQARRFLALTGESVSCATSSSRAFISRALPPSSWSASMRSRA